MTTPFEEEHIKEHDGSYDPMRCETCFRIFVLRFMRGKIVIEK
jgi:hypothetical protein